MSPEKVAQVEKIRKEEKQYHEQYYEDHKLYEEDSWLEEPVPLILDLADQVNIGQPMSILDLGCGVGRHSIPLAQKVQANDGRVVCVDLLDKALQKLIHYSGQYQVKNVIYTEQADISEYPIPEGKYDYIVAASSLEHARSRPKLKKVLDSMVNGTKGGGINCIIMNTNIEEYDAKSGKQQDALFEVNMSKDKVLKLLRQHYEGWEEIHVSDEPLELEIIREDKPVLLKADSLIFAARKP
ncbi:class I SAM-dependent methyltransferase [Paenibacillus agricola]|uniref:Class I SAM-dependent methyltransferase n=1 Tax=Paenibacillus agricola TaxID=2716264 RepID=A0ABX0JFB0_9BACL|nr:class I SAM-dependent methyltransferase [Paenibacillus agricola]NHN33949.1 class I SAM-dependent methyltransferase [Paenibacillus agricola]